MKIIYLILILSSTLIWQSIRIKLIFVIVHSLMAAIYKISSVPARAGQPTRKYSVPAVYQRRRKKSDFIRLKKNAFYIYF